MQAVAARRTSLALKLKLAAVVVVAVVAVTGFFGFFTNFEKVGASASGPTPGHTGAPGEANCTACHGEFPVNTGSGNVAITGIPANYRPNQQVPVSVTVSLSTAVIYGFQLTAVDNQGRQAGTFTVPAQNPQQVQIMDGLINGNLRKYVEHTVDGIIPTQFGFKTWNFTWTAPATRVGRIAFHAAGNASNSDGMTSGDRIYTTVKNSFAGTGIANFDGDDKSDIAVFRPSAGSWYISNSSNGAFVATQFGANGDKIVPGDYDGDGKADLVVWRPTDGVFYLLRSQAGFTAVQFGTNGDQPISGDFDGDGKTDLCVFRPSTGSWYRVNSTNNQFVATQFGANGDKPAHADFDGDGKTDIAVFRPSNGYWYILRSTDSQFLAIQFGTNGDRPAPGDYDGDGKADQVVFRPSAGDWYLLRSSAGFTAFHFGISTDKPAPADYDGDGKTDVAVFRDGTWFILLSGNGGFTALNFGAAGDIPAAAGYIAE